MVLITGFEAFDSFDVNPSGVIAEALDGEELDSVLLCGVVLPVDFNASVEVIGDMISLYHPVLVLSLGLEARTKVIHVENIGVNLRRDPYANGRDSWLRRIDTRGPFFRWSSLPTSAIVRELRDEGVPARQSWFAGTYICNTMLYTILGSLDSQGYTFKTGFLHVPLLSSQDPEGMDLGMMLEAVKTTIRVSLET
ncbi:MAG: hypothetical protein V1726_07030 [Methanobacteriota archaeon]